MHRYLVMVIIGQVLLYFLCYSTIIWNLAGYTTHNTLYGTLVCILVAVLVV